MGIFMTFILVQCAASTFALARTYFTFIDVYNSQTDAINAQLKKANLPQYDMHVEGFVHEWLLYCTGAVAIAAAVLTLVEAVLTSCKPDKALKMERASFAQGLATPINAVGTTSAW